MNKLDRQSVVLSIASRDLKFNSSVSIFLLLIATGYLQILPRPILIGISFVFVSIVSFVLNDLQKIKFILLLFVSNALGRRIMAGDAFYFQNDPIILLPYIPMALIVLKNFRTSLSGGFSTLVFFLTFLTLIAFPSAPTQVGWGFLNLILSISVARVSMAYFGADLMKFVTRLGVIQSIAVISQRLNMQDFDIGWCIVVRESLVVNEICSSNSPRLWGTMESAINTGCFLATTFLLMFYMPHKRGIGGWIMKGIQLLLMITGVFLTGSRTYLLLIPFVLLFVALKKKVSIPYLVSGILGLFFTLTSLPSLAMALNYDSRWTARLDLRNLSQDTSLEARLGLFQSLSDSLNLQSVLIGNGIGTSSRGVGSIDNGFFSLIIEVGLPMMLVIVVYIFKTLRLSQKLDHLQYAIFAAVLMLLLSNLSFVVVTGSSAFFFWFFLFNINNPNLRLSKDMK